MTETSHLRIVSVSTSFLTLALALYYVSINTSIRSNINATLSESSQRAINSFQRSLRSVEQRTINDTSCQQMLNSGSYKPNIDHTICDVDEKCKQEAWVPEGCSWHRYTPIDTRKCLKDKKVLILGDSRGRQVYIALKNRLTGETDLMDEVAHHNLKYEKHDGQVKWLWTTNVRDGSVTKLLKRMLDEDNEHVDRPDLIIFNSLLLHPTSHKNISICEDELKIFKDVTKNEVIPALSSLAQMGTKIVWMASEDMFPKHAYTIDQVNTLRKHNDFLEEEISKMTNDFTFAGMNRHTAYHKETGKLLLGDGTHKLIRRQYTQVPMSLWADVNGLLNYYCNPIMNWSDADCCNR